MKTLFTKAGLVVAGVMMLGACSTVGSYPAHANNATNVRVLVMGEDGDPRSIKRSSPAFRKVLSEMKKSIGAHGFRMVDEEAVAVDLGWNITERRPKMELMQTLKTMNMSKSANHHARAMAVFSINARMKKMSFGNQISILVDGELYDIKSNQFLNSFELPRKSYPAPAGCSAACASDAVRDHAGDIAAGVAEVLGRQLSYLQAAPGEQTSGNAGGLNVPYTLTMKRLSTSESIGLINTMAGEFPGYVSHDLMDKNPAVRRYSYTTSAKIAKLEEWLNILLGDMGMKPGRDVQVLMNGTDIIIERVVGKPVQQKTTGSRFN